MMEKFEKFDDDKGERNVRIIENNIEFYSLKLVQQIVHNITIGIKS